MINEVLSFYRDQTVFITGHTGFKGSWLCKLLLKAGAKVVGFSSSVPTNPSLFELAQISKEITDLRGDIRDYKKLKECIEQYRPQIIFHLAAQPLVRESYSNPLLTYETNVMGTVNILEVIRNNDFVKSFLNVTTDKVYKNNEWSWGYREIDPLDGFDPYSNSKSCSELVTHSYKSSFFNKTNSCAISTARAGNVIGGGDFSKDRIIPDCVRAIENGSNLIVRNKQSTRPYQHVLEPLFAYLLIAYKQYIDPSCSNYFNVGPDDHDCRSTGDLVETFSKKWGQGLNWVDRSEQNAPHEANFLKLDCSLIKASFNWKPTWTIEEAIDQICNFYRVYFADHDFKGSANTRVNCHELNKEIEREIDLFIANARW